MIKHVMDDCQCEGKRCPKCTEVKCVGAFHKSARAKSGLHSKCKECACLQAQQYYQEHAAKRRAYSREYRRDHPDKIQAANKAYYQENREQEIARTMAYWSAHPEQKQKHREWLQNNAEAVQAYSAKYAVEHAEQIAAYRQSPRYKALNRIKAKTRSARKKQAGGSYTRQEWEALKTKYNHTCLCCGKRESGFELQPDHVIPVVKGGSSNIENIQPLCPLCNKGKGRKTTDYRPHTQDEKGA